MKDPIVLYNKRREAEDFCELNKISPTFREFIVTVEDNPFFEHHGFNFSMIKHSIKQNFIKRKLAYGASTITQQLAKNLYFSFEKNFMRKIKEGFMTLRLERRLTKEQILELYLNIIYYGNGQYGITNAARFYFSKTPDELDMIQSLTLVTLVPGPTFLNPLTHPDHFVKKREQILGHLKYMRVLSEEDVKYVQNEYTLEKLKDIFELSGEPLYDDTVPMKNDMAEKLRGKA